MLNEILGRLASYAVREKEVECEIEDNLASSIEYYGDEYDDKDLDRILREYVNEFVESLELTEGESCSACNCKWLVKQKRVEVSYTIVRRKLGERRLP